MNKSSENKERFSRQVGLNLTEEMYVKLSLEADHPRNISSLIRQKIKESYDRSEENKQIEFLHRAISELLLEQISLRTFLKFEYQNLSAENKATYAELHKNEKSALYERIANIRRDSGWGS